MSNNDSYEEPKPYSDLQTAIQNISMSNSDAYEEPEPIDIPANNNFVKDMAPFYLKKTFSDISIVLDDGVLYAHKIVLVARCMYFETCLLDNPKQCEIVLRDVSCETFKEVLKYIYTGSVINSSDASLLCEVLKLAQDYKLEVLETKLKEKITQVLEITNVCVILNKTSFFKLDSLVQTCLSFIDNNILKIPENLLNTLSQTSIVKVLERDAFPLPEIKIFEIVQNWRKCNEDFDDLVLKCVRLNCLTRNEILTIVRPLGVIQEGKLLDVLMQIEHNGASSRQRNRTDLKPPNIATAKYNAKVITGVNTQMMLKGHQAEDYYAWQNDHHGITVDLGKLSNFNNIQLKLPLNTWYNYRVQVSTDQKIWKTVIDYTEYNCRGYQNLYFDQQLAQYIRVMGNESNLELVNLKVYNTSNIPKIIDQFICPLTNVVSKKFGLHFEESFELTSYKENPKNSHLAQHPAYIIIELDQPYILSTIRIRFKYGNGKDLYSVEANNQQIVANTIVSKGYDWASTNFKERPVNRFYINASCRILKNFYIFEDFQCYYLTN